jgi:preprotein translocase subunit SecG
MPNPDTLQSTMRVLVFSVIQIVLSILLVTTILLQQRGTGLGSAFGGAGEIFRTKRGIEKGLFYATIGISVLFFITAILNVALS